MGMAFLQVAQFMQEHPTKVWVIGADQLPQNPRLLTSEGFNQQLSPEKASLLTIVLGADFRPLADDVSGEC